MRIQNFIEKCLLKKQIASEKNCIYLIKYNQLKKSGNKTQSKEKMKIYSNKERI